MKRTISIVVLLVCVYMGYGQASIGLPQVTQPAPTAMQILKYGDYPVGNFTGVPDINIPLYTIKEGDLTLPISLSYHASGIKVADATGFYGLGWTLNTGGVVSVTNVGNSDINEVFPTTFKTAAEIDPCNWNGFSTLHYLEDNESLDLYQHDVFEYNFGSESGKFLLKDGISKELVLYPYKPLKATLLTSGVGGFQMIDEKGVTHLFGPTTDGFGAWSSIDGGGGDSWFAGQIISGTSSQNKISFKYATSIREQRYLRNERWIKDDGGVGTEDLPLLQYLTPYLFNDGTTQLEQDSYTSLPAEIDFTNGKVQFTYDATTGMLSKMSVFDVNGNLLQYMLFTVTPFAYYPDDALQVRYKLAAIQFYDANNNFINQYQFSYHSEDGHMPAYINTNAIDYWGYYNGKEGNTSLVPRWPNFPVSDIAQTHTITTGEGTVDRSTDEEFMRTYVLERIQYPTGGNTLFQYEANRYLGTVNGVAGTVLTGGLRIKNITSYDASSHVAQQKTYTYGTYESGLFESGKGFIDVVPSMSNYYYTQKVNVINANNGQDYLLYRRNIFNSEPDINLAPHGSPVVYPVVTEYLGDGTTNIGKTMYIYDVARTVTNVYPLNSLAQVDPPQSFKNYTSPIMDWDLGGELLQKYEYSKDGTMVSRLYNEYQEHIRDTIRNFQMYRFSVPQMFNTTGGTIWPMDPDDIDMLMSCTGSGGSTLCPYSYIDYYTVTGEKKLVSSTESTYDQVSGQDFSTATQYVYDNNDHIQPTQKITTNSKNEILKTVLKYPADFSAQAVYSTMISNNNVATVIETDNYKNNNLLQSVKTNYKDWGSGIIMPETITTALFNDLDPATHAPVIRTRVHYYGYDSRANALTVAKENDVKHTYLWGYNGQYPVTEITGADYTTASSYITQSVLDNPATTDAQMRTQLNNVRTGLAATKALVTTYTYKPLIGMSSQTDAAGRSSYYEYDGFGRLNLVRDQYQNIVKKNCYNYLGQSTNCGTDVYPQWQLTGNTRFKPCQQNPTYNSPVQQQEEKDINPASPTYNQTIWVDYAIQFNPLESEWVNTSTPVRCRQISGQNTGEQEQEQVYSNPCGDIYGWTRWVVVGTNTSTCPLPAYFTSDDESGYYYSQTCASGANPVPIYVSVPAGHSTSTISVADADQQAILYAQNYANQHGTCIVPTFPLYFNNSATDGYDVYLYAPGTTDNPLYTFYIPASTSQAIGNILPGTYDIRIVGRVGLNSAYFDVGCSLTGSGTDQLFTNVSMANNSCNTIAASN